MPPRTELTPRERQILVALAGGRNAQEIADQLHISPHTVRNQRRSAYEKLRVGSLIQAMSKLGWVKVEG